VNAKRGAALLVFVLACGASCSRKETRCSHAVESAMMPIPSPPDAAQFLRQVELRYGRLRSYADSGCAFMTFGGAFGHTRRLPFATSFAAPSTFRFEYTEGGGFPGLLPKRCVVWTERGVARRWWTIRPQIESFRTIADALIGAGDSGGSAHTIPNLLPGPLGHGWRITRLRNPRLLGAQRLPAGTVCYVLAGEDSSGYRVRVWVEPATLAIRRTHLEFSLRSGTQVDTTITYHPRFNATIDPKSIPFKPPRQIDVGRLKVDVPRESDRRLTCPCN
jgi:hypothetical protein